MAYNPDQTLRRLEWLRRLRSQPLFWLLTVIVIVGAAVVARVFVPYAAHLTFVSLYPAVALCTVFGGIRAGLLAMGLSLLAADYLLLGPGQWLPATPQDQLSMVAFAVGALLIILAIGLLNRVNDRLGDETAKVQTLIDAQPAGILAVEGDGRIALANESAERLLGYERGELIGSDIETLVPAATRASHANYRAQFMADPRPRPMGIGRDLHALTKDGSLLPVEIGLAPVRLRGRDGALATIIDISERKGLERRAEVLSNEVRHRARNLLTLVQAIARKSLPPEQAERFGKVIGSLARTQDIFASSQSVTLGQLLDSELAGFRDQVDIQGCQLTLSPRAAQDFALIVHELSANALKHGALSTAEGRVRIAGTATGDGRYVLLWQESDGPEPKAAIEPGFGQTILNDLARGFASDVEMSLADGGLRYRLEARLERIADESELAGDSGKTET